MLSEEPDIPPTEPTEEELVRMSMANAIHVESASFHEYDELYHFEKLGLTSHVMTPHEFESLHHDELVGAYNNSWTWEEKNNYDSLAGPLEDEYGANKIVATKWETIFRRRYFEYLGGRAVALNRNLRHMDTLGKVGEGIGWATLAALALPVAASVAPQVGTVAVNTARGLQAAGSTARLVVDNIAVAVATNNVGYFVTSAGTSAYLWATQHPQTVIALAEATLSTAEQLSVDGELSPLDAFLTLIAVRSGHHADLEATTHGFGQVRRSPIPPDPPAAEQPKRRIGFQLPNAPPKLEVDIDVPPPLSPPVPGFVPRTEPGPSATAATPRVSPPVPGFARRREPPPPNGPPHAPVATPRVSTPVAGFARRREPPPLNAPPHARQPVSAGPETLGARRQLVTGAVGSEGAHTEPQMVRRPAPTQQKQPTTTQGHVTPASGNAPKIPNIGQTLVAGTPAHKQQRWLDYQRKHPKTYKRVSSKMDPRWSRSYDTAIENNRVGSQVEQAALKHWQFEKNHEIMQPGPGKGGTAFIPDGVDGSPSELVWGNPYTFVEVKDRLELSNSGNVSAMLDYLAKYPKSRLFLILRSDDHRKGSTVLWGPLWDRIQEIGEPRVIVQWFPE